MKIVRVKTDADCMICDDFLSKLIAFDNTCDELTKKDVKVSEIHKNSLTKDYVYIAYAMTDIPVGYVFAFLKTPKGKIFEKNIITVDALFVDEKYRRQGFGKTLLQSVENWAKELFGADFVIEITAYNNNKNATDFYKHMGYGEIKTVLRK